MCNEETIEIIINEDGTMTSAAKGITGEICEEELQKLLGALADVNNAILRTEYHEPAAGIKAGSSKRHQYSTRGD